MKVECKEVFVVFLLISLANMTESKRVKARGPSPEELDAGIARLERELERYRRYTKKCERRVQADPETITEEFFEFVDAMMPQTDMEEMLNRIAHNSGRELRALTEDLKHQTDADLQEAEREIQLEEEKKALLESRWWRAKIHLRHSKRELEAMDRASLHVAQTMAAKIDATLEEADRLRRLRQNTDLRTERILALRKAGRQEGMLGRWWRRLSSLFSARTSKATPDKPVPDHGPVTQSPHSETNDGHGNDPLDENSGRLEEPVVFTETEAPAEEADPVNVDELNTETEALTEEAESVDETGSDTETETPVPADHAPEESVGGSEGKDTTASQEEPRGAAPQDLKGRRNKKPFTWLVWPHAAVSLIITALRMYDRLWVSQHHH